MTTAGHIAYFTVILLGMETVQTIAGLIRTKKSKTTPAVGRYTSTYTETARKVVDTLPATVAW